MVLVKQILDLIRFVTLKRSIINLAYPGLYCSNI